MKFNKEKGFNLLELLVSITIMTFLLTLSTPYYSSWMASLRVRNNAEGILLGVLQARGEAVRRNKLVVFQLNNDTSWTIKDSSNNVLNAKTSNESSVGVKLTKTGGSTVTFNGLGMISPNSDGTAQLTEINVEPITANSQVKSLRVLIGKTGATIVCDPSVSDTADDRYCRSL